MFLHLLRQHKKNGTAELGFVLVTTLSILLIISLLGAWALNTSIFELKVAGGLLRFERQFNVAEGAVNTEAAKVGFFLPPYSTFPDLSDFGKLWVPPTADFDPGNDTDNTLAGIDATDPATWPWQNLVHDNTASADEFDYRYLVTYLGFDFPPMGYSADVFRAAKFQLQGAAPLVVELGGVKIYNKQ